MMASEPQWLADQFMDLLTGVRRRETGRASETAFFGVPHGLAFPPTPPTLPLGRLSPAEEECKIRPAAEQSDLRASSASAPPSAVLRGKAARRLPDAAVAVLQSYLHEHMDEPYVTGATKNELAKRSGLTDGQVGNWFAMQRKRARELQPLRQRLRHQQAASTKPTPDYTYTKPIGDAAAIVSPDPPPGPPPSATSAALCHQRRHRKRARELQPLQQRLRHEAASTKPTPGYTYTKPMDYAAFLAAIVSPDPPPGAPPSATVPATGQSIVRFVPEADGCKSV